MRTNCAGGRTFPAESREFGMAGDEYPDGGKESELSTFVASSDRL